MWMRNPWRWRPSQPWVRGAISSQKHTRRHMRDVFLSQFMDRRPYAEWEIHKDNAPDWALAKARKVLSEHQPDPLDEKLLAEMDTIIAARRKGSGLTCNLESTSSRPNSSAAFSMRPSS